MSDLLNIGASGLGAAQVALQTTSNNISNANTAGYDRQVVDFSERLSAKGGRFTIGSGVDVTGVRRQYDVFLTTTVWNQNSSLQSATTSNNLASSLNQVLASAGNIQGALDSFYGSFSTMANTPGVQSSRQAALASAQSLVAQFNTFGQQLNQMQSQISGNISATVDQINNVAANIASLNKSILSAGQNPPNSLLDQRDQLVQTLSGYVGVSATPQADGTISIYASNGQALVSGSKSYAISAGGSVYDSSRTDVFDSSGNDITNRITGSTLGALLSFRSGVLDGVQTQLGNAAVGLAASVNDQQAKGLDLHGLQGLPMFNVPAPTVLPSAKNSGAGAVTAAVTNAGALGTSNLVLKYTGVSWQLQNANDGSAVALTTNANGTLSAAGMTFTVPGAPSAGDSYLIEPTAQASSDLTVAMTDPNDIAAAATMAATPATGNTGNITAKGVTVTNPGNPALMGTVKVSFPAAGSYQVTDSTGAVISSGAYAPGQSISANGWTMKLAGTPGVGDSFNVAQNSNGLNDVSNAVALAGLADAGVLNGGTQSIVASYGVLTTQIGTAGNQATTNLTTQTSLFNQAMASQQSVSGVNLDEEAASLVHFQQAYQASAQVITTANTIFNSLITAIRS